MKTNAMTVRRPSIAVFVLYAIAIVLGGAIIRWQIVTLHQQNASLQWPKASGSIIQSERTLVRGSRHSYYRADISYSYKVNGTRYVSSQISLWSADLGAYANRTFVLDHPKGSTVDVYYDPEIPANAVLIPGPDKVFIELGIGCGAVVMIAGIAGLITRIPRQRRLVGLLKAPDAQTRTIRLRRSDIEKGTNAFVRNLGMGFLFVAVGMGLLLGPQRPEGLEAPHQTNPWMPIAGVGFVLAAIFFFIRAVQKGRSAECPLCGDLLNKTVFSRRKCPGCGTAIVFEGKNPPTLAVEQD